MSGEIPVLRKICWGNRVRNSRMLFLTFEFFRETEDRATGRHEPVLRNPKAAAVNSKNWSEKDGTNI